MNYWLLKSEPDEFSIDDLARVGREPWTGVRNYQARNFLRDGMKLGDGVLFYHSNATPPGLAGIAKVVSEPYADPTQFNPESDYYDPKSDPDNPRWLLRDIGFERKLGRLIPLDEIKKHAEKLGDFALLNRGNRLSVMPVTRLQWNTLLKLETP